MAEDAITLESHLEQEKTKPFLSIVRTPKEDFRRQLDKTVMSHKSKKNYFNHLIYGDERTQYTLPTGDAVLNESARESNISKEIRQEFSHLKWWNKSIFLLPDGTNTYELIVQRQEEQYIPELEKIKSDYHIAHRKHNSLH